MHVCLNMHVPYLCCKQVYVYYSKLYHRVHVCIYYTGVEGGGGLSGIGMGWVPVPSS